MEQTNRTDLRATLSRNRDGLWEVDGRVLGLGDRVDLLLEGYWTECVVINHPTMRQIVIDHIGNAYMTGIEGSRARRPRHEELPAQLDAAIDDLLVAAGEAEIALTLLGQALPSTGRRPQRTSTRLKDAIYRVRALRDRKTSGLGPACEGAI